MESVVRVCEKCGRDYMLLANAGKPGSRARIDCDPSRDGVVRVDIFTGTFVYIVRHRPSERAVHGLHQFHEKTCSTQKLAEGYR